MPPLSTGAAPTTRKLQLVGSPGQAMEEALSLGCMPTTNLEISLTWISERAIPTVSNILPLVVEGDGDCINSS
jgi:hypothetical protein